MILKAINSNSANSAASISVTVNKTLSSIEGGVNMAREDEKLTLASKSMSGDHVAITA